jgi:outer membrane protein OmpA-like peptidoglycan-associated protein
MANMASTSEGANNLVKMIREGGYGGLPENPMTLFRGGSATNYLSSAGRRHLGIIFGGNDSSVMDLVAKSGGVNASSASKLMSLITPLTLGVLGKRISTEAPGSSGIADLLSRQKDEIETATPAGLSRILGLGPRAVVPPVGTAEPEEVLDSPTHNEQFLEPTPAEPARVEPALFADRPRVKPTPFAEGPRVVGQQRAPDWMRPRVGGGLRWLTFALFILAAIALLGYLLSRSRAPRVSDLASPGITSATNALARIPLPSGVNLLVPPNSINYQLANFLGDNSTTDLPKTFVFDHLNFLSGSTELTPDSDKTVSDLAQILKAYPNAQVQLTGHTDNSRSPQFNQALSLNRANTIKGMVVNSGIAQNRISTQGFGQDRPVASNDTDQGRAENRRLELTVTRK